MRDNRGMRFGVLGPTEVTAADGRRILLRGLRLRALLVLLALDAGALVPMQRLVDGLYGDDPPQDAANALQSQITRLRRTLGPDGPPVEFHPAGYRLAADRTAVDAYRFEELARSGRRALAEGDPGRAAAILREALDLWRGPALADVLDVPFASAQAQRLDLARLAAAEDQCEAGLALGEGASLVADLRDLVAAYPLADRPRAQLVRALHAAGRTADALTAFADARRTLADELGADPSAELVAAHVAVLQAPPPQGAPHRRLPAQLTSFVGRERELRRIGILLRDSRLVTLTGPGGAGKTRLAVEAAAVVDGDVSFADLSGVAPGADVAAAVAGTLGLRDAGLRDAMGRTPDPADRLAAALAGRNLLLVLDNCEHVIDAAAAVTARLLRDCPGVRVLATSREPLNITGEATCPVTGLSTDTAEAAAVRLFADRAADVQPGFVLADADRADVVRICAALDGLPLAIELAAARLRALPVAEIAARLGDRFGLLSRGSRGAQRRHQTLRAVVEWSWELLGEPERALARRLSVFAGGATLEAVEAVCGGDGVPDILDVLSGLVDKSLVEAAGGRYRMLETIRAFCAEHLDAAAETDAVARAHAAYFLGFAQRADPRLRTADQLTWLRRLDADRDNLHAALRWTIASGAGETGLRLVAALAFYWWLRGLRGEAAAYAARLRDAVGATAPPDLVEEHAMCELVAALGDSRTHPPMHGDQVRDLLYGLKRPPRHPFVLFLTALSSGPPAQSPIELDEMAGAWTTVLGDDPWSRAIGGVGIGMTWFLHGDLDRADDGLRAGLDGFRPLGERWGTILALSGAAEVAGRRGDHAAAVAHFGEALRLADELGSEVDLADLHAGRGDAHQRAADFAAADADYAAAVKHGRRAGAPELLSRAYLGQANIARSRGDLDTARQHCLTALAECPVGWFSAEAVRVGVLVTLGRIQEAAGDPAAAALRYQEAISTAVVWSPDELGWAVEGLARLALHGGDPLRAAYLLGIAETTGGRDGQAERDSLADTVRDRAGRTAYHQAFADGMARGREKGAAAAL